MSARIFRAAWAALALLLAWPQGAAAQNWRVFDTFTHANVIPGSGVSDLGDLQVGFIAQRVYQVFNETNSSAHLGPCSIQGDTAFVIANGTAAGGTVFPGLATGLDVQLASNVLGIHQATVFCQGSIGNFSYTVLGRILDPNPFLILDTLSGKNVGKNGTLNFGTVQAGVPLDVDLRITNLGNQPLTVGASVTGSGFSVVTPPPSSIAKGANATFRLRLLSSIAGTATGLLHIVDNDPNDNPYDVHLTGSVSAAPAAQIQVTDSGNGGAVVAKGSTIILGNTTANAPLIRTFVIHNVGNAALTITNPSTFLSGSGFSISSFPSSPIGAGSSTSFTVRFQAAAITSYFGTVSLSDNDPDDNPFFFNLQAAVGATPVPHIRVVDNTTGQTIVPGSTTISFGTATTNSSVIHSFTLFNDGTGTLTLSNTGSFVSGSGFSLSTFPASSISGGSSTAFTIRFLSSTAGSFTGSGALLHNDAAVANPLNFSLQGTAQDPLPVVTLSATDTETSETPSNNGQFLLTRTGSTAAALTVTLSRSGTATDGSDYSSIATTQTFAAGQSSLPIAVIPIDDAVVEDVESVTLALATGSGYLLGSPASGTVFITNNDYTACTPNATTLCQQNGRFAVTLTAVANGSTYVGQAIPITDVSGAFWLFSPNNAEVGVKILDGAGVNGKMWTFYGGATDVAYTLTVTDRANPSRVETFTKPAGSFCGGGDTNFFVKSGAAPGAPALTFEKAPLTLRQKSFTCVANGTTACLQGSRFQVRIKMGTVYQPILQTTSDAAFFWFFSPDNLESFVKVLDGTSVNGKYWVFYGSLTDQAYTIEVTDSLTQIVKTYTPSAAFCGNADISAF